MLPAVLVICAVLFPVQGKTSGIVAFSAAFGESVTTVLTDQIVRFPIVYSNFGKAYNNATGVFTAKQTGVYFFNLNVIGNLTKSFCFRLFVNNVRSISVCGSSFYQYEIAGNSVVLRVRLGESVYWKAYHDSYIWGTVDNNFSTFTGFLIS